MILESIGEVMMLIGSECPDCLEHRGLREPFIDAEQRGDRAIFTCKWRDEYSAIRRFHTDQKDFDKISQELLDAVRRNPLPSEKKDHRKYLRELIRKATIYASFAEPDAEHSFQGFCRNCYKEVQMTIRDNKLWTGCSPCASIIADSI